MDSAHPDFEDQLHAAVDRPRRFSAFPARPSFSDPVRPAGGEGGMMDGRQRGFMSPSLFWLLLPLIGAAGLVALDKQHRERRADDGQR